LFKSSLKLTLSFPFREKNAQIVFDDLLETQTVPATFWANSQWPKSKGHLCHLLTSTDFHKFQLIFTDLLSYFLGPTANGQNPMAIFHRFVKLLFCANSQWPKSNGHFSQIC
jgi:hypothetical protein